MQRNPSSGAGARPVWRRFWALSIIALPLFAFMMDSFGSAPIIPALLGSPTQRETPTPVALAAANTSAAPAPSPASAPLPTATPQLQLPKLDGTTEFSAQLRAAETHLRRDEAAYQRYLDVTNKCDRLKPGSATVLQRNDLDEGIAALARWTQGSVTGVTECRIEVTTKLAFLEGRTAAEQQRILAAALSHESAHLARVLNVSWTWVVKIDSNWLHQAMSDEQQRWRNSRRTEVRRIMDAERSKRYREFDEKLGAARDSAARQVTETRNAEAAALVRQNPNLDRARLAELVEQTIAADVARLNGRYHEQLAAGHADIDQPIAEFQRKEFADIEQNLERKRSNINSQRYREFAKRTQRSRSEDDTLREECWAHHEELYTYTAIGGTDPDTLLDLVVFLNSDDCRKLLNIGK